MARKGLGAAPVNAADLVPKSYVDTLVAALLSYQSTWSSSAAYAIGNLVGYNGNTYVCIAPVAAPAATTLVNTGSFYNGSSAGSQQVLPSGCQAGDVLMIAFAVTSGTLTRTAPISGAVLVSPALNYGNNTIFGWVWAYTLTATDVANGYVTYVSQSPNSNYGAVYHVFRNTSGSFNGSAGVNGLTSASFTPTAFPDFVYNVTFANLTAGNNSVVTQANQTSLQQLSQTGVMVIGAGYETITAGATTSRTWARTNSNGTGASLAVAMGSATGGANTAPDQSSSWVRIATAGQVYEEWALNTITGANGAAAVPKGGSTVKLIGTSNYNAATGAFTVPYDGVWEFNLRLAISTSGTTAATRILFTLSTGSGNGGTIFSRIEAPSPSAGNSAACTLLAKAWLAAGTTVYPNVLVSGGNQTLSAVSGWYSMCQVI